jgi:peptidoglycan/LPS O-acetylase OafA/YrhL
MNRATDQTSARRESIVIISERQRDTRPRTLWQRAEGRISHLLEGTAVRKNIAVLDGIRALACLAVITYHVSHSFRLENRPSLGLLLPSILLAGDTGVTLFFVLSGFLLFLPYAKSLLFGHPWPSMRQFYLRRALRILPGYYVSLFLLIILTHREYLHADHGKPLLLFLMLFMDSSAVTYRQINGPFWTLAVEWQFYLLLPLFVLVLRAIVPHGSLRRRACSLTLCLAGLAAWGVFSRWAGLYLTSHPAQTFGLPSLALHLPLFFLFGAGGNGLHGKFLEDFAIGMGGCVCYVLASGLSPQARFTRVLRRLSPWLWGIGILWLVLLAVWKFHVSVPPTGWLDHLLSTSYATWSELFFSLGYGSLMLAVLFGSRELQRLFAWSPCRWVGHISYSLYIWHLPFLALFMTMVLPQLSGLRFSLTYGLGWLWVLFTAFPFSLLFFLVVERPWIQVSDTWLKGRGKETLRATPVGR